MWQVALTHVEYLFTETDGSVEEEKLFDELRRLKILSLLVSRGKELYQRYASMHNLVAEAVINGSVRDLVKSTRFCRVVISLPKQLSL